MDVSMKLKKKILVGYGIAFTLMGLVATWSIANVWSLGRTTDRILRDYYRSIQAVENMMDALGRLDSSILLLLMGDTDKGVSRYHKNTALFRQWLDRSKESVAVEGELEVIHTIERDYSAYIAQLGEFYNFDSKEAAALPLTLATYKESILPLFAAVKENCIELRAMNEKTMYSVSEKARTDARRAIWSTLLVASVAAILAFFFSLIFAERLVRPLRRFVEAAQKISAGEFSVQLPVETSDELGQLAVEFNRMTAELRRYHVMNVDRIVAEKNKGEAILASIEDGLVVFDQDGRVTGINPAGSRILKVQLDDRDTLDCRRILPAPVACETVAETLRTGHQPDLPDDRRIITLLQGEDQHHYLFSATPIGGNQQKLTGVVLLLKDITQLREVERLKSDFIMAASHELRTPLTSLGMGIDLLIEHAMQYLPNREQELLHAAHDEVRRMKAMIHDLLDLSKIETGRIDLEFEKIAVATLFEHAREIFKGQVSMKQVNLTIDDTEFMPPVRADANKIVWVLSNLIANALRYVEEGGHIRLSAAARGAEVQIAVEDDGVGIAPEHQTRIFQKFVRVNKEESGRTGLGLAICREIVRAHRGTIRVESHPGRGSTFIFSLPIAQ